MAVAAAIPEAGDRNSVARMVDGEGVQGEGREGPWGAVCHGQNIEEGWVVGQKDAREEAREEGQVHQDNFGEVQVGRKSIPSEIGEQGSLM